MNTGTYISGAGHLILIGWVLVGGVIFRPNDPELTVMNVSTISSEDFAALQEAAAPRPADDPVEDLPVEESPPEIVEPDPPEPIEPPPVEPPPDPAEVEDPPSPPEIATAPPPRPDPGSTVLENEADNASPQDADVVADQETEAPEDATTESTPEPAVTPDEATEPAVVVEPAEETAPEETTTQIVTEADTPGAGEGATEPVETAPPEVVTAAPDTSIRPRSRPERVAAVQEPEDSEPPVEETPPPPSEEQPSLEDQIAAAAEDALRDVLQDVTDGPTSETGGTGFADRGPPLTAGEIDGFRIAVRRCWVVDPGSQAARVVVTVGFTLDQGGSLSSGPTLVSSSGGEEAAVRTAFEAARRAIVRCAAESGGFQLPPEKYEQWREVEMVFDAGTGGIR